ncbi:MAG TPA: malto-oligosyltrehalose trehalohydrolase [Noviherbaspirillum sp.]|nr:malto-oligosyltrehalose trehalohydrolase [Noviherbaspirillum sp.]
MNASTFTPSFGAVPIQTGSQPRTRFRFWAPNIEQAALEIEGREPLPMNRLPGGWFGLEADCGAGARYRYRVRDDLAVPDPASRRQADDVHDASVVCDPNAWQWKHPDWRGRPWHETVLYELHPGICGGFDGIQKRLPELAALGITAIELMPIADFPGPRNWGYDGVLHYAPDTAYGTPEQLKAMIDAAHGLGIMVFLDVVYNHFGPDGNYIGAYASDFFNPDVHTPWGQAIDFRKRPVRDFFIENALYWLTEFRFDGLRFDAVHAIEEKDFLVEMAERIRAHVGESRHVHLVLENDENLASLLERAPRRLYDAQWNDDMHHAFHVLLTGERDGYYCGYTAEPAQKLARGLAEGFIYQGEPSPFADNRPRGEPSAHLPPASFVVFLQNHDQIGNRALGERLTTLADPRALRAAMGMLLLAPHIPMLFMGEEFGAREPFLYFTSHLTKELADAVRNGRRQEFARFPAFSDPAVRERIPDPNAEKTYTDSVPNPRRDDASDWLAWTRRLLELRRAHLFPRLEGATALGASAIGPAAVLARWRMGDGAVLTLAANLADAPAAVQPLPAGALLFETNAAAQGVARGELPAHAFLALLEEKA